MTPNALTPTTTEPPQVKIDVDDAVPTDETIDRDLQEMGMTKMSAKRMQVYARLGHKIEGNGVIKTVRGYAFCDYNRLNRAADICANLLEKKANPEKPGAPELTVEEACILTHEIAFATGKLNEVHHTILGMQPKEFAPIESPTPNMPIFPPTTAVMAQAGSHVHLHQSNDKAKTPPSTT